jgi:flavin reductase (DIM6/NTAB) family NADH-FMN oxidoreductase RutF
MSVLMSLPAAGAPPPDPSGPPARASVDPDVFRRVVGHFAAGVTVVSTELDGVEHAMTASAFTSVSLDPLLVLVCVDKEARFHDAVLASGVWGVSILSASGRRAADWFATKGRPLVGQLDQFPYHPGAATNAPLLDGALAWLECRNWAVYDGGDHDIVVGEVLDAGLDDRDAAPLIYFRGRYGQLT